MSPKKQKNQAKKPRHPMDLFSMAIIVLLLFSSLWYMVEWMLPDTIRPFAAPIMGGFTLFWFVVLIRNRQDYRPAEQGLLTQNFWWVFALGCFVSSIPWAAASPIHWAILSLCVLTTCLNLEPEHRDMVADYISFIYLFCLLVLAVPGILTALGVNAVAGIPYLGSGISVVSETDHSVSFFSLSPAQASALFAFGFAVAIGQLQCQKSFLWRLAATLYLPVSFLMVALEGSIAGVLGIGLALGVFFGLILLDRMKKLKKGLSITLCLLLSGVITFAVVVAMQVLGRLLAGTASGAFLPIERGLRSSILNDPLMLLRGHGSLVGAAAEGEAAQTILPSNTLLHHLFLAGIPGTLIFILFFLCILNRVWKCLLYVGTEVFYQAGLWIPALMTGMAVCCYVPLFSGDSACLSIWFLVITGVFVAVCEEMELSTFSLLKYERPVGYRAHRLSERHGAADDFYESSREDNSALEEEYAPEGPVDLLDEDIDILRTEKTEQLEEVLSTHYASVARKGVRKAAEERFMRKNKGKGQADADSMEENPMPDAQGEESQDAIPEGDVNQSDAVEADVPEEDQVVSAEETDVSEEIEPVQTASQEENVSPDDAANKEDAEGALPDEEMEQISFDENGAL